MASIKCRALELVARFQAALLDLLNGISTGRETQARMIRLIEIDRQLQECCAIIRKHDEIDRRISAVQRKLKEQDREVNSHLRRLGQFDSQIQDLLQGPVCQAPRASKYSFSVDDLMTLSQRYSLMSCAPAEFLEKRKPSALYRPPAPQPDLMGSSLLQMRPPDLVEFLESEAWQEQQGLLLHRSAEDEADPGAGEEELGAPASSFLPPEDWQVGQNINDDFADIAVQIGRRTMTFQNGAELDLDQDMFFESADNQDSGDGVELDLMDF